MTADEFLTQDVGSPAKPSKSADEFLDQEAPSADRFLNMPGDSADRFLDQPDMDPESIRQRLQDPESTAQASLEEAHALRTEDRPLLDKAWSGTKAAAQAVPALVADVGAQAGRGHVREEQNLQNIQQAHPGNKKVGGVGELSTLTEAELADRQRGIKSAWNTSTEAAGIGELIIADLLRKGFRGLQGIAAAAQKQGSFTPFGGPFPTPTDADLDKLKQQKINEDLATSRRLQSITEGNESALPWRHNKEEMIAKGELNPEYANIISLAYNPAVLGVVGDAARLAKAGNGAVATEKTLAQKLGGATGRAMQKTGRGVQALASKPEEIVQGISDRLPFVKLGEEGAHEGGHTLGAVGLAHAAEAADIPVGKIALILKGAQAGGKTVEHLGKAVEVGSEASGKSQLGLFRQMGMNETAPSWVRAAAKKLEGFDGGVRLGTDLVKSGAHGAAINTLLSLPGAETPEEVGQAAGTGVALGGLTHLAVRPMVSGHLRRAAEDYDLARWFSRRDASEQAALVGWSRERALQAATAETVLNGITKNSNVKFIYQPDAVHSKTHGRTRGVAVDLSSDQPTIFINADLATSQTMGHEMYHALRAADIADQGALNGKLFPVQDTRVPDGIHADAVTQGLAGKLKVGDVVPGADGKPLTRVTAITPEGEVTLENGQTIGKVLRPGLISNAEFNRRADEYVSRLPDKQRIAIESERKNNPALFKSRIAEEIGAELMGMLPGESTGGFLRDINSTTRRALDWMLTREHDSFANRAGASIERLLGRAPSDSSEIFRDLQSTPEINAMLRNMLRDRFKQTKRLKFDEDAADSSLHIPRDEFLKKGGEKLIDIFPDSDLFAKDATSPRPDKIALSPGGKPILLSEGDIRRVQAQRVEHMSNALATVADTGEAGAMRQDPNGAWSGTHFTDAQLAALKAIPDDVLTPSMKAKLEHMNGFLRQKGKPFLIHYNAALKNKRYSSGISESVRVGVPIRMGISKAGNFYVETLDLTAMHNKLARWADKKKGAFADFGNSKDLFHEKLYDYLHNHEAGRPGATGLDADPVKAKRMANRLNDFLNMYDASTEGANPDRLSAKTDKDVLIRSRRFDRINSIEEANSDNTPLNYSLVKQNYAPKGEKRTKLENKMWILPDGKIEGTKGAWHTNWLAQNTDLLKKQFNFDPSKYPISEAEDGARLPALNKGFARVAYEPNQGRMKVEVSQPGFTRALKDKIFMLFADNAGKIDNFTINVLDRKGNFVDGGSAQLFQYSDREKLNHLPLISDTDEGQREKFSPHVEGEQKKEAPAKYLGYQEGFGPVKGFHMFNLTEDVPGVGPKNSTVSEEKLRAAGYDPQVPQAQGKFSPAVSDEKRGTRGASKPGMPISPPGTPAFKSWFGKSRVTDHTGKPLMVFHGTTHDFTEFSPEKSNIENDFGKGLYFTNQPKDVAKNYAGKGPDLTSRIEKLADQLEGDLTRAEAHREAKKQLMGEHKGAVVPTYLSMQKPLELGGHMETLLEFDPETERGSLVDLMDGVRRVASRYDDANAEKAIADVYEKTISEGDYNPRASDVIKALKDSDGLCYAQDEKGDLASSEIIREALEDAGYDGIIDRTVNEKFGRKLVKGGYGPPTMTGMKGMGPETTHYIAFRPEQVKSVFNSGTFDPKNPDIRYSPDSEVRPPAPLDLEDRVVGHFASRILAIHNSDPENKGSTFNPAKGRQIKGSGFAVSIFPERSLILEGDKLTKEDIAGFIKKNADVLGDPQNCVGTWYSKDSNKTFVDVSLVTSHRGFAEFMGKKFNQEGVFDLGTFELIKTGGTGEALPGMPPEPMRVALGVEEFKKAGGAPQAEKPEVSSIMPTSSVNVLHRDSDVLAKPAEGKERSNDAVAALIQSTAADYWDRVISSDDITPQEETEIVRNGVAEVKDELASSGRNAGTWYTHAIRRAMAAAGVLHPELVSEEAAKAANFPSTKAAKSAMAIALATTSQNLNVSLNTRYADEQFNILKTTGKFDATKVYGEKADSIQGNLHLANKLVEKWGWDGVEKILSQDFTVRDLTKFLKEMKAPKTKVTGRLGDAVQGAAMFGPKIGQGFLQNILGRYDPVTIDLWMRRTWGRWTGDTLGAGITPERLARLLDAARTHKIALPEELKTLRAVWRERSSTDSKFRTLSERVTDQLEGDRELQDVINTWAGKLELDWQARHRAVHYMPVQPSDALALREGRMTLDELAERQMRVGAILDKQWANLKNKPQKPKDSKIGAKEIWRRARLQSLGYTEMLTNAEISENKPEWAKAAHVIKTQLKPVDAPNNQDREVISRVVNKVREQLEAEGIHTSNADVQAILWYPEKDLWAKLRGEKESNLKMSYDDEFLKLAEARGLGEQARAAADAVRDESGGPGAARDSGQPDAGTARPAGAVDGGEGGPQAADASAK